MFAPNRSWILLLIILLFIPYALYRFVTIDQPLVRIKRPKPHHRYCYQDSIDNSTIIFLHLTNFSDVWHPLEMCSFRTAALFNPESGVCILTKIEMRSHPDLVRLPNLEFALLDISSIFENTLLADWYMNYVTNATLASGDVIWELSDALRYVYLYKYGGKYMDTDSWTLKNLSPLHNVLGWEEKNKLIANGVLFFEKNHPLMKACVENFLKYFQAGRWGSAGPKMMTSIHFNGLVDNRTYTVVEPYIFYPISWRENEKFFQTYDRKRDEIESLLENSYALHLYRKFKMHFWRFDNTTITTINSSSFIQEFLASFCSIADY